MAGTLYVVATPIGNLEDVTLRSLRVLREVALIAAEDTRVTRKLLSRYDIHTPLTSFHEHSRASRVEEVTARLKAGDSVALVSDAGTPGVSDPGELLVRAALAHGCLVVTVPGPTASVAALTVSGLPTSRFAFDGFPPRGRSDRSAFFAALRDEKRTTVLYESPARLVSTLEALLEALGDRPVAVARELTKVHEEVFRGPLSAALAHVRSRPPRGEYTLVVGPPAAPPPTDPEAAQDALEAAISAVLQQGATPRDAALTVSRTMGIPRRVAYQAALRLAGRQPDR